jgi:hypothetical protein
MLKRKVNHSRDNPELSLTYSREPSDLISKSLGGNYSHFIAEALVRFEIK